MRFQSKRGPDIFKTCLAKQRRVISTAVSQIYSHKIGLSQARQIHASVVPPGFLNHALRAEAEAKKKLEEEKRLAEEELRKEAIARDPKLAFIAKRDALRTAVRSHVDETLEVITRTGTYILRLADHELSDKLLTQFEAHKTLMSRVFC
jgi:prephenate dehydratase